VQKKPRQLIEEFVTRSVTMVRRRVWVVEPPPSERPPRVVTTTGVELEAPKPTLAACRNVLPFQRRKVAG
jgi:hypothetical protein